MVVQLRQTLCAAALATAAASVPVLASAADFPVKGVAPAAPPYVAVYNWTGFYVGGFVSYLDGSVEGDPGHLSATGSIEDNGWAVGLMGGYRYQFPNRIVLGAQISAPVWSDKGTAVGISPFLAGTSFEVETNYSILGTFHLGYAIDRVLPFLIGGVGIANVTSVTLNAPVGPARQEVTVDHTMWTVGFGLDYAATNNLVVGVRYNYIDVSNEDHITPLNVGSGLENDFGLDAHAVSFTLAYRFCGTLGGIC